MEIVKLLLEAGANPYIENEMGLNCFEISEKFGPFPSVTRELCGSIQILVVITMSNSILVRIVTFICLHDLLSLTPSKTQHHTYITHHTKMAAAALNNRQTTFPLRLSSDSFTGSLILPSFFILHILRERERVEIFGKIKMSSQVKGLCLVACSGLFYSTMGCTVKLIAPSMGSFHVATIRGFTLMLLNGSLMIRSGDVSIRDVVVGKSKDEFKWLVMRGCFGSMGLAFGFLALSELPLGCEHDHLHGSHIFGNFWVFNLG